MAETMPFEGYPSYVEPKPNGDGHEKPAQQRAAAKAKRAPKKRQGFYPFAVFNAFRDHGAAAGNLSPTERLVWVMLWSHVNSQSGLARISYQVLAEKTGLSSRQSMRVVQTLLERGYLQLVERGSAKRWACNVYRVFSTPTVPISSVMGVAK